jgi:hypothetical protein
LSHLTSDSYQRPTLHFNLYVEGLVTPACFSSGDATAMFLSPYTDRSYWLPRTTLPRGSASNSGKTDRIIYRRVTIVAHQMLHILVVCRIPALNWKHEREKKKKDQDVCFTADWNKSYVARRYCAKGKVLPGIEPGSPGCPTPSWKVMSIRTGSDNRYTIEPCLLVGKNLR